MLLNHGKEVFGVKTDFATGAGPAALAIGDLTGDGKPDVVTANASGDSISLLPGTGDGTFRPKRDIVVADLPAAVAIRDLNGDAKPDVVVANFGSDTVTALLGRGDAGFFAKLSYRTGDSPASVALGDLNGDGRTDLALADTGAGAVSTHLGSAAACDVQNVVRSPLAAAKRTLSAAGCVTGKLKRVYSKRVPKGAVISQRPAFGVVPAVAPGRARGQPRAQEGALVPTRFAVALALAAALAAGLAWSILPTAASRPHSQAGLARPLDTRDGLAGRIDVTGGLRAYSMRADGTRLTRLLELRRELAPVAVSADGSTISTETAPSPIRPTPHGRTAQACRGRPFFARRALHPVDRALT